MSKEKNPYASRITKLKGLMGNDSRNIHEQVLRTGSPSVDFTFANKWGLPRGYGEVLFGYPKGGKSLYSFAMTGQAHRDYPEGHVFKFDTEIRDNGQLSAKDAERWGIDLDRYHVIQTNRPEDVFDTIETHIAAMCDDGMDVPLIIIDSINGIMGRRMMNAETVSQQQIGDQALTLQEGFKRILMTQRRHKIGIIATAQVRAQMDPMEVRRGHHVKMATSFGVQHWAEYFKFIEHLKTKAGTKDFLGREFINKDLKDIGDQAEATAHRIRVTMQGNSFGVAGRQGIMTFDYRDGLINKHHEVFEMAQKRGVIATSGTWYSFGPDKWQKTGFVDALEKDPDLYQRVLVALMESETNKATDLVGVDAGVDEDGVTP